MQTKDIVDGIVAKKEEIGMSAQQIADASGVPKSTVDRILRGDTLNPSMQTVLDLAEAVGYQLFEAPAKPLAPVPSDGDSSPYLQHIISMYERQLADKEAAHAREMAKHERQYNLITAEKNRWIKILAVIVGILGAGVVAILLIDILNPTVGWIRRDLAYYNSQGLRSVALAVKDWFKSFVM